MADTIKFTTDDDIEITKYTTPQIEIPVEVATSQIDKFYLTVEQGDLILEKTEFRPGTDTTKQEVFVALTQTDLADFVANTETTMQIRYKAYDTNAYATDKASVIISDTLKTGVI